MTTPTILKDVNILSAHYAMLPSTDTDTSYLVEVLEPWLLSPKVMLVAHNEIVSGKFPSFEKALEHQLLSDWQTFVEKYNGSRFLPEITKVNLIKCDLLVPKKA